MFFENKTNEGIMLCKEDTNPREWFTVKPNKKTEVTTTGMINQCRKKGLSMIKETEGKSEPKEEIPLIEAEESSIGKTKVETKQIKKSKK